MKHGKAVARVERMIKAHGKRAWCLAYSLTRHVADADDVMQQACVIAMEKAHTVAKVNKPWPWFASVITNVARNARRSKARRSMEDIAVHDPADARKEAHNPQTQAEHKELASHVFSAMHELSEPQRDSILLVHHAGLSYAEAAKALDLPVGTLKSHVSRGITLLRERLGASDVALAKSMVAFPVVLPSIGLEHAVSSWIGTAKASVISAGSLSSSALVGGGVVMANKVLVGCALALGVAAGFGGAKVLSDEGKANEPITLVSAQSPKPSDAKPASPAKNLIEPEAYYGALGELEDTRAALAKSEAARRALEDKLNARPPEKVEKANANATSNVTEDVSVAPAIGSSTPLGLEAWYSNDDFKDVDWSNVAGLLTEFAQISGTASYEDSAKRDDIVHRNSNQLMEMQRTLHSKVSSLGSSHSTATSHPYVVTNVFAKTLEHANCPFSANQLASIEALGIQYENSLDSFNKGYDSTTLALTKVLDEALVRKNFIVGVESLLSSQQYAALYVAPEGETAPGLLVTPINHLRKHVKLHFLSGGPEVLPKLITKNILLQEWGLSLEQALSNEYLSEQWADSIWVDIDFQQLFASMKMITQGPGGVSYLYALPPSSYVQTRQTQEVEFEVLMRFGRTQLRTIQDLLASADLSSETKQALRTQDELQVIYRPKATPNVIEEDLEEY